MAKVTFPDEPKKVFECENKILPEELFLRDNKSYWPMYTIKLMSDDISSIHELLGRGREMIRVTNDGNKWVEHVGFVECVQGKSIGINFNEEKEPEEEYVGDVK